jgi:hypothetical protein
MKKREQTLGAGEGFDLSGYRKHPASSGGVVYYVPNPSGKAMYGFYLADVDAAINKSIRDFAYRVLSGPVTEYFSCGIMAHTGLLNGVETTIERELQGDKMRIEQKSGTITLEEVIRHRIFELLNWGAESHDVVMGCLVEDGYKKELAESVLNEVEANMEWD